jgi:hypothetical protein
VFGGWDGLVASCRKNPELDEEWTERLRAELRAKRKGSSLTEYFSARALPPASSPASIAGNRDFGLA